MKTGVLYFFAFLLTVGCKDLAAAESDSELAWEFIEAVDEKRKISLRAEFGFDDNKIPRVVSAMLTNLSDQPFRLVIPAINSLSKLLTIRQGSEVFSITASHELSDIFLHTEISKVDPQESIRREVLISDAIDDLQYYESVANYDELRVIFLFRARILGENETVDDEGEILSYVLRWTSHEGRKVEELD